jgi:DnaJ family protein C protein 12
MDSILSYQRSAQDDYYQILGCDELSTTEQICAEYRLQAVNCHPDKNPEDPDAVNKFATLQRAKEVLCDPDLRAQYDLWRRSGLAMPYEEWKARKDTIQMSLHWAMKTRKEPMIEAAISNQQCIPCDDNWYQSSWQRESGSDALGQFRNYEI